MRLIRAVAVTVLFACPACIDLVGADGGKFVERETRRFNVSGTPELNLDTFDGAIDVRARAKPAVEVIVEKRAVSRDAAATIHVRAEQSGDRVSVEAKVPRSTGFHIHYSRSARLIVSVPATSNLVARSGDGSITIEKITGRLELRS